MNKNIPRLIVAGLGLGAGLLLPRVLATTAPPYHVESNFENNILEPFFKGDAVADPTRISGSHAIVNGNLEITSNDWYQIALQFGCYLHANIKTVLKVTNCNWFMIDHWVNYKTTDSTDWMITCQVNYDHGHLTTATPTVIDYGTFTLPADFFTINYKIDFTGDKGYHQVDWGGKTFVINQNVETNVSHVPDIKFSRYDIDLWAPGQITVQKIIIDAY